MPRKTHPRRGQQSKRERDRRRVGNGPRSAAGSTVVKPIGRCRGRGAKLMFATEEIAAQALSEARAHKMATGNIARIEKRYYECDTCGAWHLTSLEVWVDKKGDAS